MNQQEIKNKMTQGAWVVDPAGYSKTDFGVINKKAYAGGTFVAGRCNNNFQELSECNTLAITHAINNTYGGNINPEIVPEMYNALKELLDYFVDGENYKQIQHILNRATLTNDIPEQKEQQTIPKAPES